MNKPDPADVAAHSICYHLPLLLPPEAEELAASLIRAAYAEQEAVRAERDKALRDALKSEFDFCRWYLTAPIDDITRDVMRRREEMQQKAHAALVLLDGTEDKNA